MNNQDQVFFCFTLTINYLNKAITKSWNINNINVDE